MDIPSIRFLFPFLVLVFAWYTLVLNPSMPEEEGTASRISNRAAKRLVDKAKGLVAQGDHSGALAPLLELHQAFPENSIYMQDLARIYKSLGRRQEEVEMLEQFMRYSPVAVEACPEIGLAYRSLNQEAKAFNAFERCVGIEENSDNLFFLAHALEQRGDSARAEPLYLRALERAPDYPDVVIGAARILMKRGKLQDARRVIDQALRIAPDNADALLIAGMVYARTGDPKAGRNWLRRGLELRPGDRDIRLALARLPRT